MFAGLNTSTADDGFHLLIARRSVVRSLALEMVIRYSVRLWLILLQSKRSCKSSFGVPHALLTPWWLTSRSLMLAHALSLNDFLDRLTSSHDSVGLDGHSRSWCLRRFGLLPALGDLSRFCCSRWFGLLTVRDDHSRSCCIRPSAFFSLSILSILFGVDSRLLFISEQSVMTLNTDREPSSPWKLSVWADYPWIRFTSRRHFFILLIRLIFDL